MAKLLLHMILIMTIAIPMWQARVKDPRAGLRKTLLFFSIFLASWFFFLVYVFLVIKHD